MGARRTNLGLLVVLVVTLVSGGLAFAAGTGWARPVVVGHGLAGLAVLVLAPWKSAIVRRGLARRSGPGRWVSVAFGVMVLLAVAAGLAHATGLLITVGPVSAMQAHVGAALVAVPLLAWHAGARRVRARRTDLSRRALLRAGAVAGGAGLLLLAVEGATRLAGLPGARRRFTGSLPVAGSLPAGGAQGVDPGQIPVTQWLDDRVPVLDPDRWRLRVRVGGATRDWTYQELAGFGDRVEAVLDCTGGWYAPAWWEGVRLDRLLPAGATGGSVVVVSRTGYRRRLPLADAGGLLLATRLQGHPLSAGHGFPARLVAPGRRGFWWVKWVTSIEVDAGPWWRQPPFPLT
ncbi:MAG TPA: molybdopterin-dependent oxidoreductase [Actinomycetes bacterium]|jgi:DMSO/TMAO reductase YedYZ molybdopterin-dependent catalytic subunit|nr:molybdopterin-dependent oxidoreductase [Actinomycetes bacterium]